MDIRFTRASSVGEIGPIEVVFDRADLARAMEIAERKVDLVNVHSPSGKVRDREIRLRRLVAGKLADHGVRHVLERFMRKNAPGWSVEEYDDVRTDGFRDPDPWDLRCVGPQDKSLLVEVRSSFVHWLRDHSALQRNQAQSLLGPYATASKQGEQPKDLFWQVAFFRVPSDETSGGVNSTFHGDERDLPLSAMVMGGGERQLFEQIGSVQRQIAEGASYRVIRPMSLGRNVGEMLLLSVGNGDHTS